MTGMFTWVLLAWTVGVATTVGAPSADEVLQLPGWTGALPSRHFSGFLDVGSARDRHIHYMFVYSEGETPAAPVVLWMNGGPGASSLIGYFTENGPFSVSGAHCAVGVAESPQAFHCGRMCTRRSPRRRLLRSQLVCAAPVQEPLHMGAERQHALL